MGRAAAFILAFGVGLGRAHAITFDVEGWVYYDPRGMTVDHATNDTPNPGTKGNWTTSYVDLMNQRNPLPYLWVCAYELDGGCRDKNPACAETDDDIIGCDGANSQGYFFIDGNLAHESGASEVYLWTDYSDDTFEVRVERNTTSPTSAVMTSISNWWSVADNVSLTSRHWNATCPVKSGANASDADCGASADSYFTSAQGYTGWYALLFRDVTSLIKVLPSYNPPISDAKCTRTGFQTHILVALVDDIVGTAVCNVNACTFLGSGAASNNLVCARGPTQPWDHTGDLDGNNCPIDAAPESHCPFCNVHEIGHILNNRWLCLKSGDETNGSYCPSGGHGWAVATTERCATAEGWGDFVKVAACWPRTSATALYPTGNGSLTNGARQVENISPGGSNVASSAANTDCECDDAGESGGGVGPQMCEGAATVALWDAYDTNPDDGAGTGSDNSSSPAANSFRWMLQGAAEDGGWFNFAWGTADNQNMEDDDQALGSDGVIGPRLVDQPTKQDCGVTDPSSPIDCARNLNDYDANFIDLGFGSEILQACGGGSQP